VSTQVKTVMYDRDYPSGIKGVFDKYKWDKKVSVNKTELLEVIDRASVFAARDRSPRLDLMIGKGMIAVMCSDAEMGLLGDVVEVQGADHPLHKMVFTPRNITDALNAAPSAEVDLWYSPDEPKFPIKIDGGSGYVAVVMARSQVES